MYATPTTTLQSADLADCWGFWCDSHTRSRSLHNHAKREAATMLGERILIRVRDKLYVCAETCEFVCVCVCSMSRIFSRTHPQLSQVRILSPTACAHTL